MKEIVTYLTGFTIESFAQAPAIESLREQVLTYFGDDVILIGHNIAFDVQFIEKYYGKVHYHATIDTFPLTQCLVHFAPSYALDVLSEYLQKFQRFSDYRKMHHTSDEKRFHDALYDCICAAVVFLYCVNYVQELSSHFPLLQHVASFVDDVFVHIAINAHSNDNDKTSSLPHLQKMSHGQQHFTQETPFFVDKKE